jgi:NAD(P)-dependent dehydrogenase (short-subunit alcohol dehydrogenase family)
MPEPAEIEAPRGDVRRLFDLDSKVIVVTGGTHGLGRAMVGAFADCGAQVVVVSRNAESCVKVAAEVCDAGGHAVAKPCHVGRWAELEPLVDSVYDDFGRIDVLVNNAGSSPLYGRLAEVSEELWDKTIALNLKGPFRLCALVGERMTEGTGGSIINVSSVGAVRPTRDIVPYAAAKAGLNAMTVALADAFGPKVRVNAIMPGPFLTRISEAWDMDVLAELARNFPMRRAGDPQEIVGAALYLASGASSYTTGTVLPVDGGAQWARPMGGD